MFLDTDDEVSFRRIPAAGLWDSKSPNVATKSLAKGILLGPQWGKSLNYKSLISICFMTEA